MNRKGDRLEVHVEYARDVRPVKQIPGARLTKAESTIFGDAQVYTVPAELMTSRRLRKAFGDRMGIGPRMRAWARKEVQRERNLKSLHSADDAKLSFVPKRIRQLIAGEALTELKLPNLPSGKPHPLMRKRPARPYQNADIALMALANVMNLNDVGTGKTVEAIGAIYEAQLETNPVLVVGPKRSLTNTWQTEFERFSDIRYFSSEDPAARRGGLNYALMEWEEGRPVAVGVIPGDIRLEKYRNKGDNDVEEDELHACHDYKGNWYRYRSEQQRDWYENIAWGVIIVDEFHKTGLNSRTSLFNVSMDHLLKLTNARFWPMSATPMGGKPRRLWPVLHLIDRKQYKAEGTWTDQWLETVLDEFYKRGDHRGSPSGRTKIIGGIRPEMEDEFYEHHKQHMVRRIKREALPGLPETIEMVLDVDMVPQQRKVYDAFDRDNEVVVGGRRISGPIVLAQYTHLRALANHVEQYSGKIEPLLEALDENGVRKADPEPGARAYIGCSTKDLVAFAIQNLTKAGIDCVSLTGDTKDSNEVLDWFNEQAEEPRVIVMTTQTGGVSLSLEVAGSAHLLDESWDPDEATQFFGRGDRGTRTTALRCYIYRTRHSIQQYVAEVCEGKLVNNNTVLQYAKEIEKRRGR